MIDFRDEDGYSLLEMIITIGLIAIAIGMSTFGLNSVFNSNVNSYANTLANEIRLTSSRELAASNKDYSLVLNYQTADDRYVATVYVTPDDTGVRQEIKQIKFSQGIIIEKDGLNLKDGIDLPITDASSLSNETTRSFVFDASSGALVTDGDGTYTMYSKTSTITRDIVVIKMNGRVYVDE